MAVNKAVSLWGDWLVFREHNMVWIRPVSDVLNMLIAEGSAPPGSDIVTIPSNGKLDKSFDILAFLKKVDDYMVSQNG